VRSLLAGRAFWFAHRSDHGKDRVKAARVGAVSTSAMDGRMGRGGEGAAQKRPLQGHRMRKHLRGGLRVNT